MALMHLMRAALLLGSLSLSYAQEQDEANFTIIGGQIYTPGLAIIDSPQPYTPEGGDTLQVAIDVSGDGRLPLPPYSPNIESGIFNITLFLTSYTTGLNLTISNGTTTGWLHSSAEPPEFGCNDSSSSDFQNAGCQEVMLQESGSTVKHVNWVWPDCLVGNGGANNRDCGNGKGPPIQGCQDGTARGPYNISIHQYFRMNGSQYYTIIDLPIQVTNSISNTTQHSSSNARPLCSLRSNLLLSPEQIDSSTTPLLFQPYLGGNVSISGSNSNSNPNSNSGPGSGTGTSTPSNTRPSAAASAGSTHPSSASPIAGVNLAIVLGAVLGAVALSLLTLVLFLGRRLRRSTRADTRARTRIGSPRLLPPAMSQSLSHSPLSLSPEVMSETRDVEAEDDVEAWRKHKRLLGSRDGLALNPPD